MDDRAEEDDRVPGVAAAFPLTWSPSPSLRRGTSGPASIGRILMRIDIRRLRSGAAGSTSSPTALAFTALAALLPGGLAAAATAQHAAGGRQLPAATFTWHKLTLVNGWRPYGAPDATPAYAISGGVVYLTGSFSQPVAGSSEFAVLPKAARPSRSLYRTVYTYGLTTGTLLIEPDGVMQASGSRAGFYFAVGRLLPGRRLHLAPAHPYPRLEIRPEPVWHRQPRLRRQGRRGVPLGVPQADQWQQRPVRGPAEGGQARRIRCT